eukprot:3073184-Rhodomonas_salina.4
MSGCIPKGCICGELTCIFNLGSAHHSHDGVEHSHPGGQEPHHHLPDGSVEWDHHDDVDDEVDEEREVVEEEEKEEEEAAHKHDDEEVDEEKEEEEEEAAAHHHDDEEVDEEKEEEEEEEEAHHHHSHGGMEHSHADGGMPHHHAADGKMIMDHDHMDHDDDHADEDHGHGHGDADHDHDHDHHHHEEEDEDKYAADDEDHPDHKFASKKEEELVDVGSQTSDEDQGHPRLPREHPNEVLRPASLSLPATCVCVVLGCGALTWGAGRGQEHGDSHASRAHYADDEAVDLDQQPPQPAFSSSP